MAEEGILTLFPITEIFYNLEVFCLDEILQ